MNRSVLLVTLLSACAAETPAAPAAPAVAAEAPLPSRPDEPRVEPPAVEPGTEPLAADSPSSAPELTEVQRATLARARQRAQAFGKQLKSKLVSAMQEKGVVHAFDVCATEAQKLTAEAQGDDVALGRSSLRLRNPKNGGPDWVTGQLRAWGERSAEGLSPVVRATDRDVRLIVPLTVEGPCLNCHGPGESLLPPVRALLDEHYPDDRATGYRVGELRGALWAIARIEG